MVETELVASSKTMVSPTLHIQKDKILEQLRNYVTVVHQFVTSSPLMDEWDSVVPLN